MEDNDNTGSEQVFIIMPILAPAKGKFHRVYLEEMYNAGFHTYYDYVF